VNEPVVVLDAGVLDRATLDGGFRWALGRLLADFSRIQVEKP